MAARARLFDFTTGQFRDEPPIKVRPDATSPTTDPTSPPPTTAARFGPTGLHWQPDTPKWDGSDSLHTFEVDCSATAVRAAVRALTATQVTEGVRVLVRPGDFGGGATESSPSLSGEGDRTWTRRVLIRPRDGFGSVTMKYRTVFVRCNNLMWSGFVAEQLRIYGGQNTGACRLKIADGGVLNIYTQPEHGEHMAGLYLGEVVRGSSNISNGDTFSVNLDTYDMLAPVFEGWHGGPNFKADTSGHTDTLQFEPYSGTRADGTIASGYCHDAVFRDMAMFGSSYTAMQVNGLASALFDNSYVVGMYKTSRYTPPATETGSGNAFGGKSGRTFALTYRNSVVLGPFSAVQGLVEVTNSVCTDGGPAPQTGAWTVDGNLTDANHPDSPPRPTDTYLASIWSA